MTPAWLELKIAARREALLVRSQLASSPQAHSSPIALAGVFDRWLAAQRRILHIAGYAAVRSELDCTPALAGARRHAHHTYYPRVRRDAGLDMILVDDELSQLHPARWGLREPQGQGIALEQLDVILVPGVTFDRHGGRLGFGGGYYDRLIAQLSCTSPRPILLGVCEARMLCAHRLPCEAHDQRMDAVMTPEGIISCN